MSEVLENCLGLEYGNLPPLLREAHSGQTRLEGIVHVERGNWLARFLCALVGMPPAAEHCRLTVDGEHSAEQMLWQRSFDGFVMNSCFQRDGNRLLERLGPIVMRLRLSVVDGVLRYSLEKTRFWGIPVPAFLAPKTEAIEEQYGDWYRFRVRVELPVIGLMIAYGGQLQLQS